jgi:predicted membrane chloride channel (bestrophin family)
MKVFSVFAKEEINDFFNDVIYVEEGFSLGATMFGALWFLYHRIWYHGLVLGVIYGLLFYLDNNSKISHAAFNAIIISLSLLVGFSARDWYERYLIAKGFKLKTLIFAKDLEEAQYRFISMSVDDKNKAVLD